MPVWSLKRLKVDSFLLSVTQFVVNAFEGQQLSVRSLFGHSAVMDDYNEISILNGRQPMSYDDRRATFLCSVQRLLHYL